MLGNSNNQPDPILRIGENSYQIAWNIQRNDRTDTNDQTIESWDYEYNSVRPAPEVSRKEIIISIVRERYDMNDELSLAMNRAEDAQKFADHESYVLFAKETADLILQNEAI